MADLVEVFHCVCVPTAEWFWCLSWFHKPFPSSSVHRQRLHVVDFFFTTSLAVNIVWAFKKLLLGELFFFLLNWFMFETKLLHSHLTLLFLLLFFWMHVRQPGPGAGPRRSAKDHTANRAFCNHQLQCLIKGFGEPLISISLSASSSSYSPIFPWRGRGCCWRQITENWRFIFALLSVGFSNVCLPLMDVHYKLRPIWEWVSDSGNGACVWVCLRMPVVCVITCIKSKVR